MKMHSNAFSKETTGQVLWGEMMFCQKIMVFCIVFCMCWLCIAPGLATADAKFFVQVDYETNSDTDSISSGTHPMRNYASVGIVNTEDDSNTILGEITMEVAADNITIVEHSDEPEYLITWNGTSAKWIFPRYMELAEGRKVSASWQTDHNYTQYVPMSIARSVNRTLFNSDGYQLATFNVTFEKTDLDGVWGAFAAEKNPTEYVDATVLDETFTTNAPIKSLDPANTNHYYAFNLAPNLIELGKPYQFSVVIRVNVTTSDGSGVKFTPRCVVGLSKVTNAGTVGNGYTASIPSESLPEHVNSASVSTDVLNSWYYQTGYILKIGFNQVSQKLATAYFTTVPVTINTEISPVARQTSTDQPTSGPSVMTIVILCGVGLGVVLLIQRTREH